jgi:glycosyltransferase involved in cell wall biosynthesis
MKRFVSSRADDYDLIFFYHIRSSQYLPRNFRGKKIIEMGDLYSSNYLQTFDNLSLLNPLKYVYFLESLLVKKVERNIFTKFDKIILFSKDEIKKIDKLFVKKIIQMNISIDKIKKKYIFSSKNKKILFIGNLKYLPNRLAITNFIKNILPKLEKKIPDVSLEVIGDISKINKIFLSTHKKVKFLGLQKNIDKFIKGSFCGLANLNIATGIQGKILSYMSYGLPVICSLKVASNFNKNVLSYRNDSELINKIISLKNNKKLSTQMSNKSLRFINNFSWKKITKNYLRIVKN